MWSIAKGILWILDELFKVIDQIWRFEFFNSDYVKKVYSAVIIVACSWLALKVMIELIMNHIIKSDDNSNPLKVYRGIVIAIVMMFMISPMFNYGMKLSTKLTEAVIKISSLDNGENAESAMSRVLVASMVYENDMDEQDVGILVTNWKHIDINDTTGGFFDINDSYRFSLNFFMLIVMALVTVCLLCFVGIQMAKRVMEIALFKIIGPFCCTDLISNNPSTFNTWLKNVMGLFLSTTVQFISLGLLINMFGASFKGTKLMTGVFLIIGALLFVINSPNFVNSLLGQNTGLMSTLGDMQSLLVMKHSVGASIGLAKGALSSTAKVIPNSIGHVSGLKTQFNNYKEGGSGTMGALGKTALSEVSRPFVNQYQKMRDNFNDNYKMSRDKYTNPFGIDKSNQYKNPYSMDFNPITNKYKFQSNLDNFNKSFNDNNLGDDKK